MFCLKSSRKYIHARERVIVSVAMVYGVSRAVVSVPCAALGRETLRYLSSVYCCIRSFTCFVTGHTYTAMQKMALAAPYEVKRELLVCDHGLAVRSMCCYWNVIVIIIVVIIVIIIIIIAVVIIITIIIIIVVVVISTITVIKMPY